MLKARIGRGGTIVGCGATDALTAKIIDRAGFDLIWVGSLIGTGSIFGIADIGIMPPTDRIDQVTKMRSITSLPIIVDGEGGWGDAPHVAYWVKRFEQAGASGFMMDDKADPFATPYIEGASREPEPIQTAVRKVKAAADARSSDDFLIVSRSIAKLKYGMEEQIRRMGELKDAGADIIWAVSTDVETLKQYRKGVKGPLLATCNINSGEQRDLTVKDFEKLGYQIVLFEHSLYYSMLKTAISVSKKIREKGSLAPVIPEILSAEEYRELVGFQDAAKLAKKYKVI